MGKLGSDSRILKHYYESNYKYGKHFDDMNTGIYCG